jgi:hypothetical protein
MKMSEEEKALWEIVKPYYHGKTLDVNAPPEVMEASKKLHELSWDLRRGQ